MFVRVVRFTDVVPERVDALSQRIEREGGPPPGVAMKSATFLLDAAQGTAVSLQFYETAEDMAAAHNTMSAVDAGETPGRRASVDMCEVKMELKAG